MIQYYNQSKDIILSNSIHETTYKGYELRKNGANMGLMGIYFKTINTLKSIHKQSYLNINYHNYTTEMIF